MQVTQQRYHSLEASVAAPLRPLVPSSTRWRSFSLAMMPGPDPSPELCRGNEADVGPSSTALVAEALSSLDSLSDDGRCLVTKKPVLVQGFALTTTLFTY